MTVDRINLDKIKEQTATGLTKLLDHAQLEKLPSKYTKELAQRI